jgi:hypothetical protein
MSRCVSWFDGAAPRNHEEAVFLDTLRRDAAGWGLDVAPDDTSSYTGLRPLYVDVGIPGLPYGTSMDTILQGAYWAGDSGGLTLQAEWGDTHLLDAGSLDEDLRLGGVRLGPEQAASMLANWFTAQLSRPIDRDDWLDARGNVIASEWRLVDTGRRVAAAGSWLRRRRAPARRTTARPQRRRS